MTLHDGRRHAKENDDVAAGYDTRMRWRDEVDWIRPDCRTHEALITDDLARPFVFAHMHAVVPA